MESERTEGQGERGVATEKRSPRENEGDRRDGRVRRGGERRDGAGPYDRRNHSPGSDEDGQRRSRRGTRERSGRRRGWPITCVGWQGDATGTEARRMRGGRGNARSCPDNPSSSLSRRCPDCRPVSLAPRVARSLARSRASSLPSSTALSLSFSLSLPRPFYRRGPLSPSPTPWGRTGEPRRSRPSAHDPRPRGRAFLFVQGCSVSG